MVLDNLIKEVGSNQMKITLFERESRLGGRIESINYMNKTIELGKVRIS
jgi:protoporphyrinogen oxidase